MVIYFTGGKKIYDFQKVCLRKGATECKATPPP